MDSNIVPRFIDSKQLSFYRNFNTYSESNPILGRLLSIPVSIIDVAVDSLKFPLVAIECVVLGFIHLVGALFSNRYTLKNALQYADFALSRIVVTPIKLGMAPIKIVFQFFAILIDPKKVQSINMRYPTFKQGSRDERVAFIVLHNVTLAQRDIYCYFNNFCLARPLLGRLVSIPVLIIDVGLDTFKTPASAIEYLVEIPINLIGALFSNKCSLKKVVLYADLAFSKIAETLINFAIAPIKMVFQFSAIQIHPEKVLSINYHFPTFRSKFLND